MKLAMKDLEPMVAAGMTKMHDYKGFTIEPIIGGYNILLYGRKSVLYIAGPSGWSMTEDIRQARSFRSSMFCREVIDEILLDHDVWVKSLAGLSMKDLDPIQRKEVADCLTKTSNASQTGITAERIKDSEYHESL
jgi:hypothetical protein